MKKIYSIPYPPLTTPIPSSKKYGNPRSLSPSPSKSMRLCLGRYWITEGLGRLWKVWLDIGGRRLLRDPSYGGASSSVVLFFDHYEPKHDLCRRRESTSSNVISSFLYIEIVHGAPLPSPVVPNAVVPNAAVPNAAVANAAVPNAAVAYSTLSASEDPLRPGESSSY
ncbi:hypothetical protein Bca4012_026510 [Brassica carinata]